MDCRQPLAEFGSPRVGRNDLLPDIVIEDGDSKNDAHERDQRHEDDNSLRVKIMKPEIAELPEIVRVTASQRGREAVRVGCVFFVFLELMLILLRVGDYDD